MRVSAVLFMYAEDNRAVRGLVCYMLSFELNLGPWLLSLGMVGVATQGSKNITSHSWRGSNLPENKPGQDPCNLYWTWWEGLTTKYLVCGRRTRTRTVNENKGIEQYPSSQEVRFRCDPKRAATCIIGGLKQVEVEADMHLSPLPPGR